MKLSFGTRQLAIILLTIVAGAIGAGLALAIAWGVGDLGATTTTVVNEQQSAATSATSNSGEALSFAEIYDRAAPAVVQVTSTSRESSPFFGGTQQQTALGSGFVIDKQGHIVTNYHVIQGADSIEVKFSNNINTAAEVVGTDPSTDLAVLKVEVSASALTPLAFGDSSAVQIGDPVVAIGNPFGFDRTITSGIVSAKYSSSSNSTAIPLRSIGGNFRIPSVIQTDAAINSGNSGGPLIDTASRVIGVNTAIATAGGGRSDGSDSGNVGIGFAISSNLVKQVVAQLIADGKATHAFLGVTVLPVTPQVARAFRLPVKEGLLVASVQNGSGADKAGLKGSSDNVTISGETYPVGGDIIVKVDGTDVGSETNKLEEIIASHKPGDKIQVGFYRGDNQRTVTVTLGNRS